MAKKATGLAAFTRPKAGAEATSLAAIEDDRPAVEIPTPRRKRGGGETVALTVKVRRSDWQRLRQLALDQAARCPAGAVLSEVRQPG